MFILIQQYILKQAGETVELLIEIKLVYLMLRAIPHCIQILCFWIGYTRERADTARSCVSRIPHTRHSPRHGVSPRVGGEESRKSQVLELRGRFAICSENHRLRSARAPKDERRCGCR